MKTSRYAFLLAFSLVFSSCSISVKNDDDATSATTVDYEKERQAILAVIEGESAAFWDKDYDKWASYWVHEPYIRTMGWWQDGGVTVVEGWDRRAERSKGNFTKSPEANPTATRVRRENMNMRIYPEVAWLTFDQYGEDTGDSLMDMPGLSRETRIMEKHDGEWKIAYVGWLLQGEK